MPTYYARKSDNVNATDVWATTPTGTAAAVTFAAGDVLVANSFTVTVNVNTDLGSTGQVRNDTTGGATAGGSFSLSNGVTLTANVFAGSAACVTLASAASATIIGNITGGSSSNAHGVSSTSTGTLTITGAVTGGASDTGVLLGAAFPGAVVIAGNVTGGASNGAGVSVTGTGSATITGTVTASANASAVVSNSTGVVTVTGNVFGAGGAAINYGIRHFGAGTTTVVGAVTGGSSSAGFSGNGTFSCTRAKGGALASAAVGVIGSTFGSTSVEEIEFGDAGASPTSGPIRLVDKTSNVAVMYRFGTTKKNLVDANASGLMPAASNVRSGVVYNGGNSTGTCAVPAAGSVALGVPVDATSGTAALTPAAVWNYATSAATTSGSMGERLKDAATVASTGQQLANALTPS